MRTLCLVLATFSAQAAWALPWHVEDASLAAEVEAQVDLLWPDAPVTVVDAVPQDADHLTLAGDALVLVRGGRVYRRAWDGEAATAVLLARTWLRALEIQDGGWTPDAPERVEAPIDIVAPDPEPTPEPRFQLNLPRPEAVVGLGLRSAPANGIPVDGIRALVGARWDAWTFTATGFLATGSYAGETASDRQMAAIWADQIDANGQVVRRQHFIDTWTLDLGGAFTPIEVADRGVSVAPSLIGALEIRRSVLRETWYEPAEGGPEFNTRILTRNRATDVGPVLGAGITVGVGPMARVRVSGLDRIRYRKLYPGAPRRWDHEIVVTTDLLIEI